MSFIWRFYANQVQKRPLIAKAGSSALILGGGDLISQLLLQNESVDWRRTGLMAFYGAAALTPVLHTWYNSLSRMIPLEKKSPKWAWLTATVFLDQAIASPVVLAMFMSYRGVIDGQSKEQIIDRFKHDYWKSYQAGWAVWIPTQFVTFYFIPLQHRLLFVNCVALGWNTYLATVASIRHALSKKEQSAE